MHKVTLMVVMLTGCATSGHQASAEYPVTLVPEDRNVLVTVAHQQFGRGRTTVVDRPATPHACLRGMSSKAEAVPAAWRAALSALCLRPPPDHLPSLHDEGLTLDVRTTAVVEPHYELSIPGYSDAQQTAVVEVDWISANERSWSLVLLDRDAEGWRFAQVIPVP